MTRPPVGSTGTLAELQVEPGDVVECITVKYGLFGLGDILTIDARGYAVNANINAFTPRGDVNFGRAYRLISRANPGQPAHIVTHDGRTYDLTALETPFGLLPEPVQEALKAWPHRWEYWSGRIWFTVSSPIWSGHKSYRAVPAPTENRVQCYRGVSHPAGIKWEHGSCIKNPDGSINWASWEDAE